MAKAPFTAKSIVWGFGGVCLGLAAGHLVGRMDRMKERAVLEKVRSEFQVVKDEVKALAAARARVSSLEKELAGVQEALAAAGAPKPETAGETATAGTDPAGPDPKRAFSDMVLRVGQARLKGQIEGRLGVLKERLRLSPEQEASVKQVLDAESAAASEALDRLMAGQGTPADFGRMARLQRGQLPDGVEGVMTDTQKPEYAAFLEQEKVSSVENRVNMELSGLVTTGGLTPEQKDQAFSALGEVVMAEDGTDFDAMADAAAVRAYVDAATARRLEVMEGILTGPQVQMYQQQVEMGREVLSKLLPSESP